MAISEKRFIETNEKYGDGIAIDEYKGSYSIVAANRDSRDDSKIWAKWGKLRNGKDSYMEKDMPFGVRLGNKQQAVQRLEQMIFMIEGRTAPNSTDDIPY